MIMVTLDAVFVFISKLRKAPHMLNSIFCSQGEDGIFTDKRYTVPLCRWGWLISVLMYLLQVDHISRMPYAAGGLPYGCPCVSAQVWKLWVFHCHICALVTATSHSNFTSTHLNMFTKHPSATNPSTTMTPKKKKKKKKNCESGFFFPFQNRWASISTRTNTASMEPKWAFLLVHNINLLSIVPCKCRECEDV